MSSGNTSNDGNRNSESDNDEGWGSKLLKVASAAAAAATVVGGLYALMSSNNSEHHSTLEALHAAADDDDEDDDADETPSSKIWMKPEFGWQKLNVDGSLDHIGNPRSAGCGGVLRDASGKWLIGFAQKLDPSYDIDTIELEAILKGMKLASEMAWEMNVKKLVVESDRRTAVSMVNKGIKIHHPQYDIINRIRQLCFDPKWEVKVVHIGRKANRVANRLAGNARHLPFGYMEKYRSPPLYCATLLQEHTQVDRALGYY